MTPVRYTVWDRIERLLVGLLGAALAMIVGLVQDCRPGIFYRTGPARHFIAAEEVIVYLVVLGCHDRHPASWVRTGTAMCGRIWCCAWCLIGRANCVGWEAFSTASSRWRSAGG